MKYVIAFLILAFTADGTVGITITGDAWECDSTGLCCLVSEGCFNNA